VRLRLVALLPRSLSGRIVLILVLGLLVAQAVSLVLHLHERSAMTAAGHVHPGMPAFDALPLRFIWHVLLSLAAVIAVAVVAMRWATRPLQQLARAADAFARDIDAPSLEEGGPLEVRRAAEAFNFMQQRLRQLVVERGRALAAVSHDLRTPLMRMRLRAELIDDPALKGKFNADIDSMQAMVNSILSYLRGLEDDEPAQAINISALVSSVVEDQCALGRRVTFIEEGSAPAPYVGRLSLLTRAVTNLIDNAVVHGGTVIVRIEDASERLAILIEDDGPGIPEDQLERAAEPFVRLDVSRSLASGGVGLGLAIAGDAAAYHGGRLALTNRESGGLRATLRLPREGRQERIGGDSTT